jgi:hypothetical protein
MAYVTPGTVAAGDVATAAAWNVLTNDVIDHETRINNSGMVLIASGTVSNAYQTFTSVFSATYENYFVTFRGTCPQSVTNFDCQLMSGASLISTNYTNQNLLTTGASITANAAGTTSANIGAISTSISSASLYIYGPFLASQTVFEGSTVMSGRLDRAGAAHSLATSYDGIKFTADISQVTRFLTGTFRVYGLR